MIGENSRLFSFGEFQIDARRRILSKKGQIVPLTPRNFDLLLKLIENEGRVITHEELLDTVWEGTFVEPANLKNAVSVLRRILGDAPGEAAFIMTIPRKGYSFVTNVVSVDLGSNGDDPIIHEQNEKLPDNLDQIRSAGDESIEFGPEGKAAAASRKTLTSKSLFIGLITICAILGIFVAWRYTKPGRTIIYDATNVNISKITSDGNLIGGYAAISPDGKYLVYAVREGENVSIWTRQIVTGVSRQITPVTQGSVWACALTPDEDYILYVLNSSKDRTKSGLYKIATFGGSAQKISENQSGSISISPDGTHVAYIDTSVDLRSSLRTMDLNGGDVREVWTESGDVRVWSVKYSPDGNTILLSVREQLPDKMFYSVFEVPAAGGQPNIVMPRQERQITDAVWLPDKGSLLISVRELNAEVRQIWQYFPSGNEWKRVTNDNSSYRGISLTNDGKTLVASQETRQTTLWVSPTGKQTDLSQVLAGSHYLINVGWAGNSKLVYSIVDNTKEMIGSINADGTGNRIVTNGDDGIWVFPAPSLDGRHISYISNRSGRRQLWQLDYDGRNPIQSFKIESDIYDGKLLADGQTMVYLDLVSPLRSLLKIRKPDGNEKELLPDKVRLWALSPDEKMVAAEFDDPQSGRSGVIVLNVQSGEVVKRFEFRSSRALSWTPDGKALAYDVVEGGSGKIMMQRLSGGPPAEFLSFKSEDVFDFDWSPDGKSFALIRGNHLTDAVKISTIGTR